MNIKSKSKEPIKRIWTQRKTQHCAAGALDLGNHRRAQALEIKYKHCKIDLRPKASYCLGSIDPHYQWQYLHEFKCPNPNCDFPSVFAWHGVSQAGEPSALFEVPRREYSQWEERILFAIIPPDKDKRFRFFTSQATLDMSRDPAQHNMALRIIRRFAKEG